MAEGVRLGEVTHFYNNISVAVVELEHDLETGQSVHFLGSHTDFRQDIQSMQVEHEDIEQAGAGQEVAVKVKQRVRAGDAVFLLTEE